MSWSSVNSFASLLVLVCCLDNTGPIKVVKQEQEMTAVLWQPWLFMCINEYNQLLGISEPHGERCLNKLDQNFPCLG